MSAHNFPPGNYKVLSPNFYLLILYIMKSGKAYTFYSVCSVIQNTTFSLWLNVSEQVN